MWYSASLLRRRVHPEIDQTEDPPLWEESIVLIEADSEVDAKQEAERWGRKQDQSFHAVSGALVKWEFIRVTELHEITDETLQSGTEIFARFLDKPIDKFVAK